MPTAYIPASIKLLDTNKQIQDKIRGAFIQKLKKLNTVTFKSALEVKTRELLYNYLRDRLEYKSLLGAYGDPAGRSLKTLFGLDSSVLGISPQEAVDAIVKTWADSVTATGEIYTVNSRKKIWGRFTIKAILADFTDVLRLGGSEFMSEGKHPGKVYWLSWLLKKGSEVMIAEGFTDVYKRGKTEKFSRTDEAIMIKTGKSFQIPSQYSGVVRNNWATRAVANLLGASSNDVESADGGALKSMIELELIKAIR